jgi:hypothetical protein
VPASALRAVSSSPAAPSSVVSFLYGNGVTFPLSAFAKVHDGGAPGDRTPQGLGSTPALGYQPRPIKGAGGDAPEGRRSASGPVHYRTRSVIKAAAFDHLLSRPIPTENAHESCWTRRKADQFQRSEFRGSTERGGACEAATHEAKEASRKEAHKKVADWSDISHNPAPSLAMSHSSGPLNARNARPLSGTGRSWNKRPSIGGETSMLNISIPRVCQRYKHQ